MAAGTSIFTLMGEIFIDNDKANDSLSKTESKAGSLGSKLGSGIKTAAKFGAAIGGAAIAGGAALLGMATKSAETTDRIDKLSQKIGISRQGFQELEYVLSQNGASIEVLQKGFKTLNDRMQESIDGTGKGAEAFNKLGLSAKDANGELKSQEQMFDESARALMKMPEGAEKSALAFDLFGKAGQELMPLLNGTEEGLDALKQSANDMGLVLSDDAVDAGAKFTDTMDNMKRSLGAVATNVGVAVMPMIQGLLDWVIAHMPEIQAVVSTVFEKIGQFVSIAIDIFNNYLVPAFQFIFDKAMEYFPEVQRIFKEVFDKIKELLTIFIEIFTSLWEKYGEGIMQTIKDKWELMKTIFSAAFDIIKNVLDAFIAIFKGDWEGLGEALKNIITIAWDTIKKVFSGALDIIKDTMTRFISILSDVATTIMNSIWDAFKYVWELLATWVSDSFTNIGTTISGFATTMFNAGKDLFQGVWDGMKDIWTSLSNWVDEKVSWLADKLMFWKKSSNEMDGAVDGSHAGGLANVPFNGYRAMLHEGERVLTREENRNYNRGSGTGIEQTVNIYSPTALSPSEIARENKKALQRLALAF